MRIGRAAALTDTGRRRRDNEDAFVLEPPLFAVADGMGGAQAGELAARLAVTTIEESRGSVVAEHGLEELLRRANARIYERALDDPATAGMGTTATVATVDEHTGSLTLAHVGDSRAYRIRAGTIEQLTQDHSLVADLVRGGTISEEEALVHPARSVITRVLGTDPTVDVDTVTAQLEPGDVIVLCSDGLTAMVRDEAILDAVTGSPGPVEATEALVVVANRAGGDDNITVVVFEVVEGEPPERPDQPEQSPTPPPAPDAPPQPARAAPAAPPAPAPPVAGVVRHGASKGSRWPALLLIAAVLLVGALALWWGISR
jgi:protein phosphatase